GNGIGGHGGNGNGGDGMNENGATEAEATEGTETEVTEGAVSHGETEQRRSNGEERIVFLVMGPWHHGQEIGDGSALGALKFNSDTALSFRRDVLRPFLDQYLKDGAPRADVAPVTAFETGTNTWRRLPAWPAGCASGCSIKPTPVCLTAGLRL